MDLLAAFQAYLIYAITGHLSIGGATPLVDQTTMIALQEFAYDVCLTGLICAAEIARTRPTWESWSVASAKRRTLFAMFIFENIFNSTNNIKSYIADALEKLPAPASKALWEAKMREAWQTEYDIHLAEWKGDELRIGELWPQLDEGVLQRRERVDRWVQSVDEFGMMLFSICVFTHGG